MSHPHPVAQCAISMVLVLLLVACGSGHPKTSSTGSGGSLPGGSPAGGAGGTIPGTGGTTHTGGQPTGGSSAGGTLPATGGTMGSGGQTAGGTSAGGTASGGTASGGRPLRRSSAGGRATGGNAPQTGGTAGDAGVPATGGMDASQGGTGGVSTGGTGGSVGGTGGAEPGPNYWDINFSTSKKFTHHFRQSFNLGWRFLQGSGTGNPAETTYADTSWEKVNVPHSPSYDAPESNSFYMGPAWYRKSFTLPAGDWTGKKVFIEFGAAMSTAQVWVNGTLAGSHGTNGYTSFVVDITSQVKTTGSNVIAVKVDNSLQADVPPAPVGSITSPGAGSTATRGYTSPMPSTSPDGGRSSARRPFRPPPPR